MESRKIVVVNLFAGQQWSCRHREQTCGHGEGRREWDELREYHGNIHITICKIDRSENLLCETGSSTRCSVTT